MTKKKIFEKYAEIWAIKKKAERELEVLSNQIKGQFRDNNISVEETPIGKFLLSESIKYTYSDAVKKLQEREKKNGIAIPSKVEKLIFTPYI